MYKYAPSAANPPDLSSLVLKKMRRYLNPQKELKIIANLHQPRIGDKFK